MPSDDSKKVINDPLAKAMERAQAENNASVRQWVRPSPTSVSSPARERSSFTPKKLVLDQDYLGSNCILRNVELEDRSIIDKYRLLRTRILHLMKSEQAVVLGITSPGAKAGKSVTAINLAISIARGGNEIVTLIDCDVRRPSIASYVGIPNERGVLDFINDDAGIEEICYEVEDTPNLRILPGLARNASAEADVLKSPRMKQLLRDVPQQLGSSVVIVDMPPVTIGDDVLAIATELDCLLLVVNEENTQVDELKAAIELIQPFNLIGSVMNMSSERSSSDDGYYQTESN